LVRAKTKDELLSQSEESFSKLWLFIDSMSNDFLKTEFDFSEDASKKENHWSRDKNLRDVLIHLYEWHQLLLRWIDANLSGNQSSFLPAPYNWKTYGEMNIEFWEKHQLTDLATAKNLLRESHASALERVKSLTNEELFTKQFFSWTGSTTLGSYCVSSMSSHYEWAIKKLKAHVKNCA